jgi:hypothetical protein
MEISLQREKTQAISHLIMNILRNDFFIMRGRGCSKRVKGPSGFGRRVFSLLILNKLKYYLRTK